jgi:hypothetical protein
VEGGLLNHRWPSLCGANVLGGCLLFF